MPRAAVGARGQGVVAWADGAGRVRAATGSARRGWSTVPVLARAADGFSVRGVQTAADARGGALVVSAQATRRSPRFRVLLAERRPGGRFGRPALLGTADSIWRAAPQVAVTPSGAAAVAWTTDAGIRLRVRGVRGRWERTRLIRGGAEASLALDPRAVLHLAYRRLLRGPREPIASVVDARSGPLRGPLAPAVRVATSAGRPHLEIAPDSTRVVTYLDYSPGRLPGEAPVGAPTAAISPPGERFAAPVRLAMGGMWDTQVAVGPAGQAVASGDPVGGGSPTDPAAPTTWLAVRPAGGAFEPATALSPPGTWSTTGTVAVTLGGTIVVPVVTRRDDHARTLAVAAFRAGDPPPAPAALDTSAAGRDTHNAWFGAVAATAGPHVLLVWADARARRIRAWWARG